MASVASPYGLKPVQLLGGQPFAGSTREIKLSTNNSAAIYNGDIVQLSSAGNPQVIAATPTTSTAGIVGVCLGVRYTNPATNQPLYAQYLPANAITSGYTNVFLIVADDPDMVFQVQGSAAFGTLTNGAAGAVGKNAALGNFTGGTGSSTGSTFTGNSVVNLTVGTNGASLASTNTLAVRIVGVVAGTETDLFPELLVKFNQGVHSYYAALGV